MNIKSFFLVLAVLTTAQLHAQIINFGPDTLTLCQANQSGFSYSQQTDVTINIYHNGVLVEQRPSTPLVTETLYPCCGYGVYTVTTSTGSINFVVLPTLLINILPGNCVSSNPSIVATNNIVNPGVQWNHFQYEWIKDSSVLSSNYGQLQGLTLASLSSGNYKLVISDPGGFCTDTSNTVNFINPCIPFAPIAIRSFYSFDNTNQFIKKQGNSFFKDKQLELAVPNEAINAYPNPFCNYITIESNGNFMLINQVGKVLKRFTITSKSTINLEDLPSGEYVLTNEERNSSTRIIKQ